MRKRLNFLYFLEIFLFLCLSSVFWFSELDILVSSIFFKGTYHQWIGNEHNIYQWIYKYGVFPTLFSLIYFIIRFIYSFSQTNQTFNRIKFSCVIVAILIGPGILVHNIAKPLFERPRPFEIKQFGGKKEFVKPLFFGSDGESFPSGHAAAGFSLTILGMVSRRSKRLKRIFYFSTALLLGSALGVSRISTGGHFLSDILWAFVFTQLTNLILVKYVFRVQSFAEKAKDRKLVFQKPTLIRKVVVFISIISIILVGVAGYLISRPFKVYKVLKTKIPRSTRILEVKLDIPEEKVLVYEKNKNFEISIDYLALGHGLESSLNLNPQVSLVKISETRSRYSLRINKSGYISEYNGRIKLFLPDEVLIDKDFKKTKMIEYK